MGEARTLMEWVQGTRLEPLYLSYLSQQNASNTDPMDTSATTVIKQTRATSTISATVPQTSKSVPIQTRRSKYDILPSLSSTLSAGASTSSTQGSFSSFSWQSQASIRSLWNPPKSRKTRKSKYDIVPFISTVQPISTSPLPICSPSPSAESLFSSSSTSQSFFPEARLPDGVDWYMTPHQSAPGTHESVSGTLSFDHDYPM